MVLHINIKTIFLEVSCNYAYFEQICTVTHKNIQAHMHMCMHHNYFITPRNGVPCGEVTGVATCAKNDMTQLHYVHDLIPNQ